jgi:hypothetical protein
MTFPALLAFSKKLIQIKQGGDAEPQFLKTE